MQQFKVRAGYEGFSCFWTVFLLVRFWWFTVNRESGHTRDSISHTYSWRVTATSAMSRAGQGTTGASFGRAGGIISGAARARDARAALPRVRVADPASNAVNPLAMLAREAASIPPAARAMPLDMALSPDVQQAAAEAAASSNCLPASPKYALVSCMARLEPSRSSSACSPPRHSRLSDRRRKLARPRRRRQSFQRRQRLPRRRRKSQRVTTCRHSP